MNSDEKMNEVKKAYANMILNITKEAAARVMVSERKAARLEEEIKRSKDEAVFMLMRLKQMMDAKHLWYNKKLVFWMKRASFYLGLPDSVNYQSVLWIWYGLRRVPSEAKKKEFDTDVKHACMLTKEKTNDFFQVGEAEMASRAQVKKIDELEAQLHEAEDIVMDLREELSSVQRQLARASQKEEVKRMVQVDEGRKENIFSCPNSSICPPPDKQQKFFPDSDKGMSNIGQKLYKPLFPSSRSYYKDMDLPAIISRSQGKKRYRSGCTQRILACEQKNLIQDDLTTQVDESHNPEIHPSPGNETRKIKTIASPNKKQKISSPNPKKDRAADSSSLTTTRPELQPLEHEKSDLPLSIEAVDPPEAKALETDGVPTKPLVTYQKRRKQGTVSTDRNDVSNCKLKNTQDSKNAVLETEKVNSMQESAQEETKEVFSVKKSAKEEIPLEPIA
ncbi:hypothetical protein CTI12_AA040070 [Artemisia annua]|uniref:Uncharacterized protein n=1 Tax=Artemisia annua TaxID=35608 RepID=A0A2U1QEH0_ARTAN|nr:hypothetical protein CTI12_AA040070 [Artemisia annua]